MTMAPKRSPWNQEREHVRIPLRMSAEVHFGGDSLTASTRDLSEGGCGLELARPLAESSEVTIGLFLVIDDVEDERIPPLWVKGRVVWCAERDNGGAAAGVRFEVITNEQRGWIRQVITHMTAIPG